MFLASFSLALTDRAHGGSMEMEDVRALAAQKSWHELLEHAKDVAPSKRAADWNHLVAQAGVESLKQVEAKAGSGGASNDLDRDVSDVVQWAERDYPSLGQDKAYQQEKTHLAIWATDMCSRDKDGTLCVTAGRLLDGLSTYPNGLAVKAAKLLSIGGYSVTGALITRLWVAAVHESPDACREEKLAGDMIQEFSNADSVKASQELLNRCFATVKEAVFKKLDGQSKGSYFRKNACPVILAQSDVPLHMKKACKD